MKKFVLMSAVLLVLSRPAFADDFVGACKAGMPGPAPAGAAVNPDALCTCEDQQTTNDAAVRAELLAGFKNPNMIERMNSMSPAAKAVAEKCVGH